MPLSVSSLSRWRAARRAVLSAITIAGLAATSAAVLHRGVSRGGCHLSVVTQGFTYSGVGLVMRMVGEDVVVHEVVPGAPAEGLIHPGARLVAVDGRSQQAFPAWAEAIRGAPGTTVQLEVAYPCGGHQTVEVTRGAVHFDAAMIARTGVR